jgi:hypothetical protein
VSHLSRGAAWGQQNPNQMLQRRRVGESRLRVPHATGADWAHLGFEGLPITRVIAALPSRGVARWQAATVESHGRRGVLRTIVWRAVSGTAPSTKEVSSGFCLSARTSTVRATG